MRAAGPGRVSFADRLAGRGVVAITHGRLRTTYMPVRPIVRVGRRVTSGTVIGRVEGERSHCPTTCLHWGLRSGDTYLNPVDLVRRQVRLLPHWSPAPHPDERDESAPAEPRMGLRDATTATGGALTGMVLAYALAFVWRRARPGPRVRPRAGRLRPPPSPPPGVIDLSKERRLRRTP
ncbi:hypothetical protein BJF79_27795 [Actinomadura sp. CNU-125]|nr:hypothetical protein BJF79_27795 [Actinomadura sp. CNU-125]